jgi:hypothetical protein
MIFCLRVCHFGQMLPLAATRNQNAGLDLTVGD